MVLQRAGDDLRRAGRPGIYKHHDGQAVGQVARPGVEPRCAFRLAPAHGHHLSALQERIGHVLRALQHPARVGAQVKYVADGRVYLRLQGSHRLGNLPRSLLVKAHNPHVAHAAWCEIRGLCLVLHLVPGALLRALHPVAHRVNGDRGAREGQVNGRGLPLPRDGQGDLRAHGPAHFFHSRIQAHAHHRLPVYLHDEVPGLNPGLPRGGLVNGRDDLDQAVFHGHLDAQAAELPRGLLAHIAKGVGVHVVGVRVELREHPGQRGLNQLRVRDVVHVLRARALKDLPEQVEIAIRLVVVIARRLGLQNNLRRGRACRPPLLRPGGQG